MIQTYPADVRAVEVSEVGSKLTSCRSMGGRLVSLSPPLRVITSPHSSVLLTGRQPSCVFTPCSTASFFVFAAIKEPRTRIPCVNGMIWWRRAPGKELGDNTKSPFPGNSVSLCADRPFVFFPLLSLLSFLCSRLSLCKPSYLHRLPDSCQALRSPQEVWASSSQQERLLVASYYTFTTALWPIWSPNATSVSLLIIWQPVDTPWGKYLHNISSRVL